MNYPDFSEASCKGLDLDIMFMPEGSNGLSPESRAIRRMCNACPCQEPCLEWALRHEPFGWWGGTNERERRRMRQTRRIPFQSLATDSYLGLRRPKQYPGVDREAS